MNIYADYVKYLLGLVYTYSMSNSKNALGVIQHTDIPGRIDHLFRISLKALVFNEKDEVLLVKESGKTTWDIPGGGMDHGEKIEDALRRELEEEVNLVGSFNFQVLSTESPTYVENINIWQMRIVYAVWPENTSFSEGEDGDEIQFATINSLKKSSSQYEQLYGQYAEEALKIRK
jgi:ADP-ribose pyrophosphatase YjhB (NUDIX family)